MSTILKALRRLEEERSFEQAHSLHEHVAGGVSEAPRTSPRLRFLALLAGGVAAAAAGGLAFAFFSAGPRPAPPAVAAAATPSTPAPQVDVAAHPPPATTPFVRPARREAARRAPARREASAPRVVAEADLVEDGGRWNDGVQREIARSAAAAGSTSSARSDNLPSQSSSVSAAPASAPAPQEDFERAATYQREQARAAAARPTPDQIIARRAREPEPEPQPVAFAEDMALVTREPEPLSVIDDLNPRAIEPESPLSAQVEEPMAVIRRASVPGVEVVRTTWHPLPARREALIRVSGQEDPLRLSEGDAVGPLVLLEIQPAGVVFAHGSVQIQRRVGDRSGL